MQAVDGGHDLQCGTVGLDAERMIEIVTAVGGGDDARDDQIARHGGRSPAGQMPDFSDGGRSRHERHRRRRLAERPIVTSGEKQCGGRSSEMKIFHSREHFH